MRTTTQRSVWIRMLAVASAGILWQGSPARAQPRIVVAPPNVAGDEAGEAAAATFEFNQGAMVFFDESAVQTQLEALVTKKIAVLDRRYHLSASQQQRLRLAGQGDIRRLFERFHVAREKFVAASRGETRRKSAAAEPPPPFSTSSSRGGRSPRHRCSRRQKTPFSCRNNSPHSSAGAAASPPARRGKSRSITPAACRRPHCSAKTSANSVGRREMTKSRSSASSGHWRSVPETPCACGGRWARGTRWGRLTSAATGAPWALATS